MIASASATASFAFIYRQVFKEASRQPLHAASRPKIRVDTFHPQIVKENLILSPDLSGRKTLNCAQNLFKETTF